MADYAKTAHGVLAAVGGEENVLSVVHCATRLRFMLKNEKKVDLSAVRGVPGVITTAQSGPEFQVVIGSEVPDVFAELTKISQLGQPSSAGSPPPNDGNGRRHNPLTRFVAMISAIFSPLLWALAAVGLLKAFLSSSATFGWLDSATTTYVILNAISDAFIYFLPMALAVSAAKYFGAQQFTSLAIAGTLLHPSISELNGAADVTFFGVPATIVGYAYGVVPIIVAVWLQSHLERILHAKLPAIIRRFLTPVIVLLVLVPFVFLAIGPVSALLTGSVANGISWVFQNVPWLGGAVMGGLWQVLVISGVHSGFTPFFVSEYQQYGYGLLLAPLWAAVLSQAGAAMGVWVRTKDSSRKALAGSATVSALLAGVTEPAVYGVTLPLRRPFIFGIIGGAVGGGIISGAQVAINAAIVFPSALSIPALTGHGDFLFAILGIAAAMLIGFGLTVLFGFNEDVNQPAAPAQDDAGDVEVQAPMDGNVIRLSDVADPAFAKGGLGIGAAIVPTTNTAHAPFDGQVVAVFPTGHAIGLRHADGVELLIHIGLDTVKLAGKHFSVKVKKGQHVKAGDPLVEFDRQAIAAEGYDLTSPVVITNVRAYPTVSYATHGSVLRGDKLFTAVPVAAAQPAAVP